MKLLHQVATNKVTAALARVILAAQLFGRVMPYAGYGLTSEETQLVTTEPVELSGFTLTTSLISKHNDHASNAEQICDNHNGRMKILMEALKESRKQLELWGSEGFPHSYVIALENIKREVAQVLSGFGVLKRAHQHPLTQFQLKVYSELRSCRLLAALLLPDFLSRLREKLPGLGGDNPYIDNTENAETLKEAVENLEPVLKNIETLWTLAGLPEDRTIIVAFPTVLPVDYYKWLMANQVMISDTIDDLYAQRNAIEEALDFKDAPLQVDCGDTIATLEEYTSWAIPINNVFKEFKVSTSVDQIAPRFSKEIEELLAIAETSLPTLPQAIRKARKKDCFPETLYFCQALVEELLDKSREKIKDGKHAEIGSEIAEALKALGAEGYEEDKDTLDDHLGAEGNEEWEDTLDDEWEEESGGGALSSELEYYKGLLQELKGHEERLQRLDVAHGKRTFFIWRGATLLSVTVAASLAIYSLTV